ncbi:uncharacterized protein LOC113755775 [Coffea eugenioides]|uniref:uncharacterized protein LOC113755775 n=1 Tax=Coffea eugenioides TaxID=49369 RepID=UPI000F604EB0|nr:uncharacterized protein LOC113755775 [Coffea eugenioides]
MALEMEIKELLAFSDSDLLVHQTLKQWVIRDSKIMLYHCNLLSLAKEADCMMKEVHSGIYEPHMNGYPLAEKIIRTGYFWLIMEYDCVDFVRKCVKCQMHDDIIRAPVAELHSMIVLWPYLMWGMDVIGTINSPILNGHRFILVAIEYFTKWVKTASYKHFKVRHRNSAIYRPQMNGAVEAAIKNLNKIIRKITEAHRDWHEKLPYALMAYRTTIRTSTGATHYSLMYGMETALPTEVEIPYAF